MNKKKIAMEQQRVDSSNKKTIEGKSQNYNSLGIRYLLNEVKNFWMIVAKISTIASFILLITLMFYVQKNKYIPYVVQVNQEGAVLNSGVINKSSEVTANEKEIKYFLNQFIFNLSTVTLDEKIQDMNIKNLGYFLTDETQAKIISFLNDEKIKDKFLKKQTTSYKIYSIVTVPDQKNQYQIRWSISTFDSTGNKREDVNYTGIFQIAFVKIKTEEMILNNPLGIIISQFTITKDLGGQPE